MTPSSPTHTALAIAAINLGTVALTLGLLWLAYDHVLVPSFDLPRLVIR